MLFIDKIRSFITALAIFICCIANAANNQWTSKTTGSKISFTVKEASKPALDASGKRMTVVYLENLAIHPKYCDWGNGKVKGGANKSLGAIEVNPDAAKKVKAAVRTLRHFGSSVGLGNDIAVYGFSRGSTAASLAIGDAPFEEWLTSDRCPYAEESSDVQAAVLGPGVFNYGSLPTTMKEYTNMKTYCGNSTTNQLWKQQGGALAIKNSAVPAFLFYNTSDEAYYAQQMAELMSLYDKTTSTYELLKDFGQGHSIPVNPTDLQKIYDFLNLHLQNESSGIEEITQNPKLRTQYYHDLQGRKVQHPMPDHIYIKGGRKVLFKQSFK